jgi:hypothetical protein
MRTAIIKIPRQPLRSNLWINVINEIMNRKFKVNTNFKEEADLNIVLSGQFENPRGFNGKRVMILNKREWIPSEGGNSWDNMYRDIVKHYYDEIIDVTDKNPKEIANTVVEYIHAEERKADKRGS